MESIKNKTVLITGASSGIGESCAKLFAQNEVRLILTARRIERLRTLASELKNLYNTEIKTYKLDVRNKNAVNKFIKSLPAKWRDIDILVNNAGLSRGLDKLYEGKIQDWEEMIDTNLKGLLYVSRAVIPSMVKRNTGHIVNIGSIAGHEVYPKGNVYCATKHAVGAITTGMRIDLNGTNVHVTTIDPGLVKTEFSLVRFRGNEKRANQVYTDVEVLSPDHIADAVLYAVTRPENMVVAEMLVLPLSQATTTLVNRSN